MLRFYRLKAISETTRMMENFYFRGWYKKDKSYFYYWVSLLTISDDLLNHAIVSCYYRHCLVCRSHLQAFDLGLFKHRNHSKKIKQQYLVQRSSGELHIPILEQDSYLSYTV